jgi:hypothetical protein
MANGIAKNIKCDHCLESYQSFFDHPWAKSLAGYVAGSSMEEPATSLLVSWKAAANTHMMPWLLIETLVRFSEGYGRSCETLPETALRQLAKRIPAAMGDSLSNMKRRQLETVITDLGHQLKDVRENYSEHTDPQSLFDSYLNGPGNHELQLSLWGTQRVVFGALYHAYESFVTCCIGLTRNDPNYRPAHGKVLLADAKAVFDAATVESCLADDVITTARLVRNALAHHGGRETEELKNAPHGLAICDGELQLMPDDNRALFTALKERASKLTNATMAAAS